jgi:hypothetical protein
MSNRVEDIDKFDESDTLRRAVEFLFLLRKSVLIQNLRLPEGMKYIP